MPSQSTRTSDLLLLLTRFVIPPKPVKCMKEGNLYVRCRNGKKEFVRKLSSPKTCDMPRPSRGNHISSSYEMASRSLVELEQHRALLLEERALRERLDQQERIGFRTRRPYRWNRSGSFSSSSDGPRPTPAFPEPVPDIVNRHPRQYRRRRRSSNTSTGSSSERSGNETSARHRCPSHSHGSSRVRFEPEEGRHCTPVIHPMPPRSPHVHSHPHHTGHHNCPYHHRRHRHDDQRGHFQHFDDSSDEEYRRRAHTVFFFPEVVHRHERRHGSHGTGCPRVVIEERRPQDYD